MSAEIMYTLDEIRDICPALAECSLFDQIPEDKYPNILHCLSAQRRTFKNNQTIINIGENSQMAGLVLSGRIELAFFDENGNQINVDHMVSGQIFGATLSCCEWALSTIQLKALEDCDVMFMNFRNLLVVQEKYCPFRAQVTSNLLRDFARQTEAMNEHMRIICQKKLRDKIKIYLQTLKKGGTGCIEIPFSRHELADYLYVDRSALSRELCRMRDEGIIAFEGKTVTVLDDDFLYS